MAKVSLSILKNENQQGREKAFYHNIFCDEVFWTQYNILQTHKLMYDYLNQVKMSKSSDWFCNTTWHLKNDGRNTVLIWKKKYTLGWTRSWIYMWALAWFYFIIIFFLDARRWSALDSVLWNHSLPSVCN